MTNEPQRASAGRLPILGGPGAVSRVGRRAGRKFSGEYKTRTADCGPGIKRGLRTEYKTRTRYKMRTTD